MKPLISIIVPVYNVEKYLNRCLDSLVSQEFKDYEIIVVNDGSPDNSQIIINQYEKKYPKLISSYIKENGGLGDARNFGLLKANGKFIIFIDSDDWIESLTLSSIAKEILINEADLLIYGYYHDYSNDNIFIKNELENKIFSNKKSIRDAIYFLDMNDLFNIVWNKVYNKEIIDKNNISFPLRMEPGEDLIFNIQYFKYIKNVRLTSIILYHYMTQGEVTLSSKFWTNKYEKCILFNEERKKLYEYYEMFDNKYNICYANTYVRNISSVMINLHKPGSKLNNKRKIQIVKKIIKNKEVRFYADLATINSFDIKIYKILIRCPIAFIINFSYAILMVFRTKFSKIYYKLRIK